MRRLAASSLLALCYLAASLLLPGSDTWAACQLTNPFRVNQFGYLPTSQKVIIAADPQSGYNSADSFTPSATFEVRRTSDNGVAFSGTPTAWNEGARHEQSGDKVWWFDFSALTTAGNYRVCDAQQNICSDAFTIGTAVYDQVRYHAIRAFYYNRSGHAKTAPFADARWVDGVNLLGTGQTSQARLVTDKTNAALQRDLRGGWYDAGDPNSYTNYAVFAITDLLHAYLNHPTIWTDNFNIPESGNGIPDILDEVKWSLDWLLRMQTATGNGSVLSKVSALTGGDFASPPSADTNPHYYGAASTASTACTAGVFALAAKIFNGIGQTTYGTTLANAAASAWTWANDNPAVGYDNSGFSTVNAEPDAYGRDMCRLQAAIYLYGLTGTGTYKTYVESNYTNAVAMNGSNNWQPWNHNVYVQDALLYYSVQSGIAAGVKTAIENSKIAGIGTFEYMGAITATPPTDAYRAFLKDGDYVWGSNQIKAQIGNLFADMVRYNLDSANATAYRNAAASYLHYILGVNPNNVVYMSNMNAYGAERSTNEIWHSWFFDGTIYDNALTSPSGPAPGYIPGGPNEYFGGPASLIPPHGQPRQKAWLDSNLNFTPPGTLWNTWEVTEPGIYYQAAFIRLLSFFITPP